MNPKELNRVAVIPINGFGIIRGVCEKRLTQIDASRLFNLTRRHIQRLVNQYQHSGASGLVSLRRHQFIRTDSLWLLDETYIKVKGK